ARQGIDFRARRRALGIGAHAPDSTSADPASLRAIPARFDQGQLAPGLGSRRPKPPPLLLLAPVADVGIQPFAAFLVVGAVGEEVEFLAVRARIHVAVIVTPGVLARAGIEITAFLPVAYAGIVGL